MKHDYTSIRLEITSGCNLNCSYCHNAQHSNRKDDMTTDEIITLIRNLKNHYDIKKILLTGGEPLIKKDICKIVAEITRLGIKPDMVTNGTLLTPQLVTELEKAGLKRIRISLDEVSDQTQVRGISKPNDIWNKAKMVTECSKIELCIHTVCTPFNVNNLYDVYKKVIEVGARRWRVFDIGYQGDFVENSTRFNLETYYNDLIRAAQSILTDYLKNHLMNTLDIEINNIFRTEFLFMKKETFDIKERLTARLELSPCNYISAHQLSIRSNGQGTLCQYFHNPIFNFKESNLNVEEAIHSHIPYKEFELKMKDLPYCSKCKYCMVCNSGCRARAEFLTENIRDADPVACYVHPMVHHKIMAMLPSEIFDIYKGFILNDGLEPKYSFENLEEFLREKGYNA